jgi:kumamolisin
LHGHWRPAFAAAPYAGPLADDAPVHLVLGLALPDPAGLDAFIARLYDPHDALYRRFLTPDQFTQRFSPSQAEYQAVLDFAHAQGFTVLPAWPDRLGVSVDADAAAVRRAFHVQLQRRLRRDGSEFYAPDRQPVADVTLPLADVSGLDNWARKRPRSRPRPRAGHAGAGPQRHNGSGGDATWLSWLGETGFFQGWDFRQAYFPDAPASLQGAGQSIGLIEYQGFWLSDISAYCAAQSPPIPVPTVTVVAVDHYRVTPVVTPSGSEPDPLGDNSEVSLDMEAAMSMAPQASLVVYEGPYTASLADLLHAVVQAPLCRQVSCSWSSDGSLSIASLLAQMAAQGQAFVNASGDNGAYDLNDYAGPVGLPDSLSPYITEAGGTSLTTQGPDGVAHWCTYTSESTWNNFDPNGYTCNDLFNNAGSGFGGASGGGICSVSQPSDPNFPSDQLGLPSWQSGFANGANGGSNSYRNIPDVSMNAQGFWVTDHGPVARRTVTPDFYGGTDHEVLDGTSGAAPLWAGALALANQQAAAQGRPPVGFANPWLYQLARSPTPYAQAFHDIADGSDNAIHALVTPTLTTLENCDPVSFKAVTGYDLATGLGSPNGMGFINALVGLLPTPTLTPSPSATPSVTPSFSVSPTFSVTPSTTPTFTASPSPSDSPTATPSPAYLSSGQVRCVLAPQPARDGEPLTLYFKAAPARTRWQVYDLAGEQVAQLDIHGPGPHRCPTDHLAPGLYFAHIVVDYADGSAETLLLKAAVVR